ncbi:polyketide synthase [candidate division KSB1 bacterium]|nr:polyketide synthase [candidate division KSB1 bacterium]
MADVVTPNHQPTDGESVRPEKHPDNHTDIAIIGMACRFPGAQDYEEFWNNLESGKSSIREIPSDRFNWRDYYGDPHKEKNKFNTKWGGFIDNISKFDARFFGISSHEAICMDPQQRILLELVWNCIEDAGYNPKDFSSKNMGLFIGVTTSDYHSLVALLRLPVDAFTVPGLSPAILANRVSFLYGFTGPSEPIDTACSSSLVAIQRAKEAMNQGFCDTAIVGGVNALVLSDLFISFSKAGMLSPDGQCRTFDKNANGYVRGEGCGLVLLKKLDKAIADNDHIYGIIKGSSVNHGGRTRNLTSPSAFSQSKVIIDACVRAKVSPETISYIEAHGTGTSLGDPIEINGLKRAFSRLYKIYHLNRTMYEYCGLVFVYPKPV